jgi:hypothetical protein
MDLQLTPQEIEKFTMDGSHMRKYLLQKDGKLPTCLHSWGSQATSCLCGCRSAGFSDALIRQRGIYAQVIPYHTTDGAAAYRHVHPVELALLNGFVPPQAWLADDHPDLRLCLCAVGQLASPLQSIWVGGCALKHLQAVLGLSQVNPGDVLASYRRKLFQAANDVFHVSAPVTMNVPQVEIHHPDGTNVHVHVADTTTLSQLCRAEVDITKQALEGRWCDASTGVLIANDECVAGRSIRVLPFVQSSVSASSHEIVLPLGLSPDELEAIPLDFAADISPGDASDAFEAGASTGLPVSDGVHDSSDVGVPALVSVCDVPCSKAADSVMPDALLSLKTLNEEQLAALVPPLVRDSPTCLHMRLALVSSVSRLDLLQREGRAMGDDELNMHSLACVVLANDPGLQYLDPLLATSWIQVGTVADVQSWIAQYPDLKRIATVVHMNDHWTPVIWTKGLSEVQVSIWEHDDVDINGLCALHGIVSQAWNLPMFALACTRRSFGRDHCGAAAVAYLAHVLIDAELPQTEERLHELHHLLRARFTDAVQKMVDVPKPWCWGLGTPDVLGLTSNLLLAHGVPQAQSLSRAKLVVQSLGRLEVQKAVTGVSPWKSLKALANMQKPVLQLVLPDEAAQKVIAKQQTKSSQSTAPQKALPARPVDMDPTKLLLDSGAFRTGNDEPLTQIPFTMLGPLAKGVALTSYTDAVPILRSGQTLTSHGLAMIVLNPPEELCTSLQWSTLRFAVRCAVNQEPMLLTGVLVQLGQQAVYQFRAKDALAVPTVDVACARITVYQDQLDISWEEFTTKPVKHILSVLSCLRTCRQEDCSCPSWHPKPDTPPDALLDVFRRQYFNDAGRPVKWDKASHYAVMLRYIKGLEAQVLAASGLRGLYVEPKTEDALKPHSDFQVVWLPQMEFQQVAHLARCEMHCLGLARTGRRYGIRVHVSHFPAVFASVKPDAVYLAPGSRLTYHCGPWPYGSDRKNLAKILKASGWECRPLQPLHGVPGGLMWAIQAVNAPPSNVLSLSHGQIVITSPDTKPVAPDSDQVVGPAQTVKLCMNSDAAQDPWLTHDPWRKATSTMPLPPAAPSTASALQEMEDRLEQTILAKLPMQQEMEVDSQDQRLQQLEQQFQQLASRQTALESTVNDHHVQSTAQVQSLQQQVMVQLDMQSKQMQGMLSDQMSRLETILSKKARTE